MKEREHLFSRFWGDFCQNKVAMLSLAYVSSIIILSIFVSVMEPEQAIQMAIMERNELPSWHHWFGTDQFGRDLFVRMFKGVGISLFIGFMSAFINGTIGVVYGSIAGFSDGWLSLLLMRVADIVHSIPSMIYVILITVFFGATQGTIVLGMCVSGWVVMARVVRGEVIYLKTQPFVLISRMLGYSTIHIFFRDILINMVEIILVQMTILVPQAIFMESILSFIGIGLSPPHVSMGVLAQEARIQFNLYPIQLIYPLIIMGLLIMALNFISDGLMKTMNSIYGR